MIKVNEKDIKKLIDILNHRMTKIEKSITAIKLDSAAVRTDISWLKRLLCIIVGLVGSIFLTAISIAIKFIIGG